MSRNQKAPEKSSFTQRCSLLSRYMKEKGSFGHINFGLLRKPNSDLELLGNSDPQGKQNATRKAETKGFDIFQMFSKGETSNSSGGKDDNLSESGSSQLTIFFGGKVLVYNEFPADKAKEIMEVAKQAKPVTQINIQTQSNVENNRTNVVLPDLNEPTNSEDDHHPKHQQNQVVERIARRASLHRFFAKRKDRAVARAPYQINQNASRHHYPTKPVTVAGQPLEQGQSSHPPDNAVPQTVSHFKPQDHKDTLMEVEEEGQSSKDLELKL